MTTRAKTFFVFSCFLCPWIPAANAQANLSGGNTAPGLPSATLRVKARNWAEDTVGPGAWFGSALGAGLIMASLPRRYPREWRQGGEAFGRNFGNYFAQNATAYTTRFAVSALLREDTRYRSSERRGFLPRFGHALAFTVVDRSDSGTPRIALSNFAAAFTAGQVTRGYMPPGFDDQVHAGQWSLLNLGALAGSNVADEFKPELRAFARKLHLPFVK